MISKKYDWLGLCFEMMSEYIPIEICSKSDAEKYWNISEHLLCLMEFSEPNCHHNRTEKLDKRNNLVKDMIKRFTIINMNSLETANCDTEAEINFDNVVLNNLLLLSIFGKMKS
jgi:hypothetical protein